MPSLRLLALLVLLVLPVAAAPQQAERMASQLLKRAEQLVEERGISYLEAVESLLKKVIEARSGDGGGVN